MHDCCINQNLNKNESQNKPEKFNGFILHDLYEKSLGGMHISCINQSRNKYSYQKVMLARES